MADNVPITAGSGTNVAADDIGSVFYQRVKVTWGPDGTANDADVATGKPLPIQVRSSTGTAISPITDTEIRATALPVSVATIPSHAVTNAGTFATQLTTISSVAPVMAAASTAAAAADRALVVALSPNGINANGQTTMSASAPVTLPSDQTWTGATNLGKAEDAVHASGDVGVMFLGVRKDTAVALAADGDYQPAIFDPNGRLYVTSPALANIGAGEYETVAASQTAQALGATGATGDYINGILVIPATTSPGVVTLLDNATSIPVFVGGATSVSNLVPFFIPLGLISVSGAWKITTGANVSCIGMGNFT